MPGWLGSLSPDDAARVIVGWRWRNGKPVPKPDGLVQTTRVK